MLRCRMQVPGRGAIFVAFALGLFCAGEVFAENEGSTPGAALDTYILLGWNDLGMHCSNKYFRDLAVLPPFNTLYAQVIRRGSPTELPQVIGPGLRLTYEFENNTYSVGKTDFWSYEDQLFGVQLPDNVGLTGKGMTGTLDWTTNHYEAPGTPLTPFTDSDLLHEQPYELALLRAFDGQNTLLASTEIVAPVSNEMTCSSCHHATGGESVELAILRRHDEDSGTNLAQERPVLCARCHASNALGLPGNPKLQEPVSGDARAARGADRHLLLVSSRTDHPVLARCHVPAARDDVSGLPWPHAGRGPVDRAGPAAMAG